MSIIIYHNKRCSKSRQTLQLIEQQGIEPEIIDYLAMPPNEAELKHILALLKLKPRDLMRQNEDEYKIQALNNPELSDQALIRAMSQTPKLIERPIVLNATPLNATKAIIGRPPENVLAIL